MQRSWTPADDRPCPWCLGSTPLASTARSAPCTAKGYRAIGVANPLRGLGSDAATRGAPGQTIEGPTILVAHSYGGAVISNAATGNDQVKVLVFLAGWALDEGESIEQLLGLNEGSMVLPALRQVPFTNPDGSEGVDLYLDQEAFPACLCWATSTLRWRVSWRPPSARGALRRSARCPGRRRGSRSPRGRDGQADRGQGSRCPSSSACRLVEGGDLGRIPTSGFPASLPWTSRPGLPR